VRRLLWALPKAAPALLRHLAAYVDLAGLELTRARREIAAQIVVTVIIVICAFFALGLGCLAVIAFTWDTPHRVGAIAWMAGGFLGIGVAAAVYLARVARSRSEFLASVRREWLEDRVLLERLLSSDQDGPHEDQ
jgi:uncharacterized membrane protein YqjE